MTDTDAIRERHQSFDPDEPVGCSYCGSYVNDTPWPCDAVAMADALDAARADADALAEALREALEALAHHVTFDPLYPVGTVGYDRQAAESLAVEQARAALAAHDATKADR